MNLVLGAATEWPRTTRLWPVKKLLGSFNNFLKLAKTVAWLLLGTIMVHA